MTMHDPRESREHDAGQQPAPHDAGDDPAHSGEGAASAMAQLISRGQQVRRHSGDNEHAAGSQGQ